MISGYKLQTTTVFFGRSAPEDATLVGYGAILKAFGLAVPAPRTLTYKRKTASR